MALAYYALKPFTFGGSVVETGDLIDMTGLDSNAIQSLLRRGLVVGEDSGSGEGFGSAQHAAVNHDALPGVTDKLTEAEHDALDHTGLTGIGAASFLGDLPVVPKVWGTLLPQTDTTVLGAGCFDFLGLSMNDIASRLGVAGGNVYIEQDTAATVDSSAAIYNSNNLIFLEMLGKYRARFSIPDITSVRFFSGVASTTTTVLGADDPGGTHMAGVQFSTNRGDTNFQFVSKDGTTIALQDSGIAATTDIYEVEVDLSTANEVTVTLYDAAGTQLATHTFSANVPAAAMKFWSGLRNLTAAVRSHRFFGAAYIAPGV